MAQVRALEKGFHGGSLREVGEVFEATGKASWFTPLVVVEKPKAAAPKAAAPKAAASDAGDAGDAGGNDLA